MRKNISSDWCIHACSKSYHEFFKGDFESCTGNDRLPIKQLSAETIASFKTPDWFCKNKDEYSDQKMASDMKIPGISNLAHSLAKD